MKLYKIASDGQNTLKFGNSIDELLSELKSSSRVGQVFDLHDDIDNIDETKNTVHFTFRWINNEKKTYWIDKERNLIGQYSVIDGKKFYQFTLDFEYVAGKELIKQVLDAI